MRRGLRTNPQRNRAWHQRSKPLTPKASKPKRQAISPASEAQREKVRNAPSIVSGRFGGCDPCHVWPRSLGGCDDPLCVIPLTRAEHRAFDRGELDVLPAMLAAGMVAELQHALAHADGSPLRLLERVTGEKWVPVGGDQS